MKQTYVWLSILAFAVLSQAAFAYTWYVDAASIPPGSGTQVDPYAAITSAVAALAGTNATEGLNGGHLISVASGTYGVVVALNSAHSGAPGNPNTILATTQGTRQTAQIQITGDAGYLTIDGFNLGGSQFYVVNSSNLTFRNCSAGGYWYAYEFRGERCKDILLDHCAAHGVYYAGIYGYGAKMTVRNSIITDGGWGIECHGAQASVTSSYNCFYGNQINIRLGDGSTCHEAVDINSLPGCSNNIVGNPGFSDLVNNWDFGRLYSNSPCLDGGEEGSDIGSIQNPILSGVSNQTYYVKTDGDDAANGKSLATAWQTLKKATAMAGAGDTVLVQPGVYSENNVTITNGGSFDAPVTYRAEGAVTINGVGGCSYCLSPYFVNGVNIDGFSCGGSSVNGIRVYYSGGVEITNVTCMGMSSTGIMGERMNDIRVSNCHIAGNQWGIRPTGGMTISASRIYTNQLCGVKIGRTPFHIRNSNVIGNGGHGISGDVQDTSNANFFERVIENCVIYGNSSNGVAFTTGNSGWWTGVTNTIIANNTGYGLFINGTSGDFAASYNCFFNNTQPNLHDKTGADHDTAIQLNALPGCTNNIVADPLLANPAGQDYRLQCASPCINAGTPGSHLRTDMYGNPRVQWAGCDIGSFEMAAPGTVFKVW